MSDTFCAYIAKGARLHFREIDGQLYFFRKPCCHIKNQQTLKQLRDYIPINKATDIEKHPSVQWYRNVTKYGSKLPEACDTCIRQEEKGDAPSIRQQQNERYYAGYFDGYDISRLDIVLGNTCNLACAFCGSNASSLIEKLSKELDEAPYAWNVIQSYQPSSEKVSHIIADILKTYKVHTLKIIGGEPFLKENWDRIGTVLDSGIAKDCEFQVTTNGTVLNDKVLKNLSNLKATKMNISVDGVGRNYEFMRWPHTWKKMLKNLQYIRDNCPDNVYFQVSLLVNILNFEYLPEIEQTFKDLGIILSPSAYIGPNTHPLNYENLPIELIDYIRNKISNDVLKQQLEHNQRTDKDVIRKQVEILLKQRNMKAEDVLGLKTRNWIFQH